jgi:hypothetical protein
VIHLDGYKTDDDNEEGTGIGFFINGEIYYRDPEFQFDPYVKEVVDELKKDYEDENSKFYYVYRREVNGEKTLLGFNLNEEEKNELFYEYDTPSGGKTSCSHTEEVSNAYGCHKAKFKNEKQAIKELITKPEEFNKALEVMKKHGLIVLSKDSKIVSYQAMKDDIF